MRDLVDPDSLFASLDDPLLRIVDVRWYLEEPLRGPAAYADAHIPGAVYADLDTHLSAADGPGRHPLPARAETAATLGMLGIGDQHRVVAYDDRGGAIAARLWWMLRDLGHERAQVLDGGLPAWLDAGFPTTIAVPELAPATLTIRVGQTRRIDREGLSARLGDVLLLDARQSERFRGDEEPVDPIAGHIPTARNLPYPGNLDDRDRFLDAESLAARFASAGIGDADTVVYCGSGVTACLEILAMRLAGLPEPILYPGSWSDWCTAGMPVAAGPEPESTP
jgi:thiosulfate/3-mercaptopyruvate sulfurtransferase